FITYKTELSGLINGTTLLVAINAKIVKCLNFIYKPMVVSFKIVEGMNNYKKLIFKRFKEFIIH
ncbi:hypothetical protein, partial [Acinetobacter guillouiae]|uniref:hypothetical protein n=1 Tax=Acinetobacter guillouiae TaxID=106649 RepID=UPI0028D189B5